MLCKLKPVALIGLFLVSACRDNKSPCDDKLVVLQGDGPSQVESQWDACVARNASKIAVNRLNDQRLAEIAAELCKGHAIRYADALRIQTPLLGSEQIARLVEYKQEGLLKIAVSELDRARKLGCEAK